MAEEIIINNKCFIASQTDLKEYMDNITDAFYCEVDKCDEVIKLKQENKELKALNKKICEDWEKEIKVYWNALEEIRSYCKSCENGVNARKIKEYINEVLDES